MTPYWQIVDVTARTELAGAGRIRAGRTSRQQHYCPLGIDSRPRKEEQPRQHYYPTEAHMRRAAPDASSITPVTSLGSRREGAALPRPLGRTYCQEGPLDMSPHNDRCTSQAPVSPHKGQPDTVAASSSSRVYIHSSIESIRRASKAHHRMRATEIICDREEQNHPWTHGVKDNSRTFDTTSHGQYRWRRRHGPAHLAFAAA
jgi:hypothetical protein